MELTELKELLQESQVFAVLSDEELQRFTRRFEQIHFKLGQEICRAGEEANAFYVVLGGRARVVADKSGGEETTVGTLTRGNSFGEQGLLARSTRNFTVRAAADLSLARLKKEDFERSLLEFPELRGYFENYISEIAIRNFLKLATVFSSLSPSEIKALLNSLLLEEYAAEETIVREGEAGDAFFILRTGRARAVKTSEGGKVLARYEPGAAFGELALLTGQVRAASVIASEPCSVYRLGADQFNLLLASAPKMREAIINLASGYSGVELADRAVQAEDFVPDEPARDFATAPEPAEAPYQPKRARKYIALLQQSETDCGAACLAMILRYYGKYVSVNRLRELANVGREGATLFDVSEAAERLGFRTRGLRASYDHLLKMELPAIVHWEGYHYIVLYEAGPNGVVVADPASGLRKLTREEFEKGWTGYLLQMRPTAEVEQVEESRTTITRYLPLILEHKRLLGEILLASLLLQVFGLASPIFSQVIFDDVLVHQNAQMLNSLLAGMLIIALFQSATVAVRQYLLVHTSRRIDLEMMVDFYRHLQSLPIRFFEDRKVGDILKRFEENAKIRAMLTGRALGVLLSTLSIFVYLALMLVYSPKMTFVALCFIPAYAFLILFITPILQRQFREAFQRGAEADSFMVESISGMATVKATSSERLVRWKLEGLVVKALNISFRSAVTSTSAQAAAGIIQSLNAIILFWFGAHLVIDGELTIGQLVAFQMLTVNVTAPILSLIDLWNDIQEVKVSLERLGDVMDTVPEGGGATGTPIQLPRIQGHIRFENVTFAYPSRPDKTVLQNVTLEILPGQTVALVGRSGAGKSTFANLMLRLHDPTSGRILIDGYDLHQVALGSLRGQIGVVPQDVFLFSGTILENIAFGNADAKMTEVVGAAMLVGAHEFIAELPLGYQTVIGERGQSLSGGQKQRIAIARALFRRPRILIFDEATSALDTESERAIQANLDEILRDRTTFIIAHRLSTVRNADMVIVMDKGNVVESGDHASLMAKKGLYYYLNTQQLEG